MNILIKLTCLVGLVIAPILGGHHGDVTAMSDTEEMVFIDEDGNRTVLTGAQADQIKKANKTEVSRDVMVEMSSNDSLTTANVTIKTTKDGKTTSETKTFTGTMEEVKAQVEALKNANIKVEGGAVVKELEVTEKKN